MKVKENRLVIPIEDYGKAFKEKFAFGLKSIYEAGRIYAEAVRKYKDAREYFEKIAPEVRDTTWDTLLHIGNGDMPPEAYQLMPQIRDKILPLPYHTQEILARGTKQTFVLPRTLKEITTTVSNATPAMMDILVDSETGKIRSVEEQKTILAPTVPKTNARKALKPSEKSYHIVGKTLRVRNVVIGIGELRAILREMEGQG